MFGKKRKWIKGVPEPRWWTPVHEKWEYERVEREDKEKPKRDAIIAEWTEPMEELGLEMIPLGQHNRVAMALHKRILALEKLNLEK